MLRLPHQAQHASKLRTVLRVCDARRATNLVTEVCNGDPCCNSSEQYAKHSSATPACNFAGGQQPSNGKRGGRWPGLGLGV